MVEIICTVTALAVARYCFRPSSRLRISRAELQRYQRLSEEIHRREIQPFE